MSTQSMPKPLMGADAELYAALAECGRVIEAMPRDERWDVVNDALPRLGLGCVVGDDAARSFVVGVMLVAHQRRLFDLDWQREQQ